MSECPDCKQELEQIDTYTVGKDGGEVRNDEPYFKCHKCQQEYSLEDIKE